MRPFSDDEDRAGTSTEEVIVQMYFWKTIIANMLAVVSNTTGTTYTMLAPATKREVHELMFLYLLLGRQLRIEQLGKLTDSCFFMLSIGTAFTRFLNLTRMNWVGTCGYKTNIALR